MDNALMLRRQRELLATWLELDDPPRRALRLRRPQQWELVKWKDAYQSRDIERTVPLMIDLACGLVDEWRGFTEADLLGAAIGSDAEQPFAADLFRAWITGLDDMALYVRVAEAAFVNWKANEDKKAAAAKN